MTIQEVLERIKEIGLQAVSKEIRVDRHRLQRFLRGIGAEHKKGTREWRYEAVSADLLQQPIYDHVHKVHEKRKGKAKSERTNERKSNTTKEHTKKRAKEGKSSMRKRASFDIDTELLKELRIYAIKQEKNTYEIVEQAIRNYLREQGE